MANVSTGQVIAANDHNSIVAAIKGTTGENLTVFTAGAQLVSASALTLPNDGNYWAVNGSATINTISTLPAGTVIKLRFNGVNVALVHSANIILSDAANYTTASGDVFEFISEGSGVWRETARSMYALTATIRGTPSLTFSTANNMGTGQFYLSRNATIALFDTTAARSIAFGDVGTTGGVNFASPRDHGHAFALGAAIVPSVGNVLQVASTNGNLGWGAGGASGAAGGDLTGTYPNPTLAAAARPYGSPLSGNILMNYTFGDAMAAPKTTTFAAVGSGSQNFAGGFNGMVLLTGATNPSSARKWLGFGRGIGASGGDYSKFLYFRAYVSSGATTNITMYMGVFGDTIVPTATARHYAFRYQAAGAAGNWLASCADGATETSADTGVAVTSDYNAKLFEITFDGTTAKFYINGTLVASITTNIPTGAAATNLSTLFYLDNNGTTSSQRLDIAEGVQLVVTVP